MAIPIVQESGKVTIYLPKEDWDYVRENYEIIAGTDEGLPWSKFFMKAMGAAMATRKPDSSPEDKARIIELIGNVDMLTLSNDEMKQQIVDLLEKNTSLKEMVSNSGNTKTQSDTAILELNQKLQNQDITIENQSLEIAMLRKDSGATPDNAIIVLLSAGEKKVIEHTAAVETERTGAEVTPGLLLKNVFSFVLINGPHDMFKAPVSIQKIRELMSDLS